MLCDFNCKNEGLFKLKNGKVCCCKSSNSCPEQRKKNKGNLLKERPWLKGLNINREPYNKGKKLEEIVSLERAKEIKKIQSETGKIGYEHTEETKKRLSVLMSERYAAGWEVKCGRAPKFNYESPIAGIIKVDGSWELKVAKYLDSIGVEWKRNKERFEYDNTIKNKISTYCPDFYVKDWNIYIEVKGYKTELDEIKWKQFKFELKIWDKNKLKELKIL